MTQATKKPSTEDTARAYSDGLRLYGEAAKRAETHLVHPTTEQVGYWMALGLSSVFLQGWYDGADADSELAGRPRMLTVICPKCYGSGPCGDCCGRGTLDVWLNWSDERRAFSAGERYVDTEFPPFKIGSKLYVYDGAGDTIRVDDEPLTCSLCDARVPAGAPRPLCSKCDRTAEAHGRALANAQRYPDPEHPRAEVGR